MLLAAAGHKVTLLMPNLRDSSDEQLLQLPLLRERQVRIEYCSTRSARRVNGNTNQVQSLETYLWLKERHFNVIHFSDCAGLAFYAVQAKHVGVAFETAVLCVNAIGPTAWEKNLSGVQFENQQDLAIDFMERRSIALADLVLCSSNTLPATDGVFRPGRSFNKPRLRFSLECRCTTVMTH
jgi:hypothetical protein